MKTGLFLAYFVIVTFLTITAAFALSLVRTFPVQVLRVVDGDTIDVRVDLGFDLSLEHRVRLLGVDTPEVYGVRAGSPEHTMGRLASSVSRSWVEEHRGAIYLKTDGSRGKYGRLLGHLCTKVGGDEQCLNDVLIGRGWGR